MKKCKINLKQNGAATLTVVMILLLAILLPALAIMRYSQTHEQMVSASVDRARAFEAAEAGLREGEIFASTKPAIPVSGCSAGMCATPTGVAPWKADGFWDSGVTRETTTVVHGITARYIVEYLGTSTGSVSDCTTGGDISPDAKCDSTTNRYRVTARAQTPTGAEVILQSNFLAP